MNNSRMVVTVALALMLSMMSAVPALAVTVSRIDGLPMDPAGEPFSAVGSLTLQRDALAAPCNVTLNGTITTSGTVRVTSVTIPKKSGTNCLFFSSSASGVQPWTGQFDSATQLTFNNATLSVPGVGSCGPSKLALNWTGAVNADPPTITFVNAVLEPSCKITGTAAITPGLVVQ
ncbi:hypothetical protein LMG6871_00566 [Ralstonia edaphis]|uniref:hypothetical protein n=1 Tax=Ralstonia edaphi TaxID=3058599 RepID=UPI0028F520B3|nr:hypothetical protein [Ralstonia sp. LMG 6871]CAJ0712846.1 hypothetical protein LMG6871_00566 [Ralstonia sp. LMG 6871]